MRRFHGVVPKLRWLYWRWVRFHRYEVCFACGRPLSKTTPTWWYAPDDLWNEVEGGPYGIRCVPCFTRDCKAHGITVSWLAVEQFRNGQSREA